MHNTCICGHGECIHDYELIATDGGNGLWNAMTMRSTNCRMTDCKCERFRLYILESLPQMIEATI